MEHLWNTKKRFLEDAQVPHSLRDKLDIPLHKFLVDHKYIVFRVQEFAKAPFAVKKRISRDRFKLLYEGRFLSRNLTANFVPYQKNVRTTLIVLDKEGNVEKCTKLKGSFPKSHTLPKDCEKVSFGELVMGRERAEREGCNSLDGDPQSQPEAVKLLEKWDLSLWVTVDFCVSHLPVSVRVPWIFAAPSPLVDASQLIRLEAFMGQKNLVRYRIAKAKKSKFQSAANNTVPVAKKATTFASEANRSSGMTVHLTGLSLALKLGLLSTFRGETSSQVLERLRSELSRCNAYLWLQRDNLGRVSCVTYYDRLSENSSSFEIGPGSLHSSEYKLLGPVRIALENEKLESQMWQDWKRAFDYLWLRRDHLILRKQEICNPLFEKWGELGGGTHGRCLSSIQGCLKKVKVSCFSRDDSSLHEIKLFFARYLEDVRKKCTGVRLRTVTGTKILCLQSSEVDVENISPFFDFSTGKDRKLSDYEPDVDAVGWASRDWCPELGTVHHGWTRRVERAVGDRELLLQRGNLFVLRLSAMHEAFSQFLCRRWDLDLTTCNFMTLSSLSLRIAMLDFWEKAGPTAQSLEKTKPHWEDSLRKLCRGGFSYSCRASLFSGKPLQAGQPGSEEAVSVAEFDLKSCYGFCLTNMSMPGAFGIGYTFDESSRHQVERGHDDRSPFGCRLKRTDLLNRAKSFEYLGVQAVIRSTRASTTAKILSVWSNFSPFGVFYVGKFPVDLAVVFEGEGLRLFQFDGQVRYFYCLDSHPPDSPFDQEASACFLVFQFAHGCPTGECLSLPRYASGAPEDEVLEATRRRDAFLKKWVEDYDYDERKRVASRTFGEDYRKGKMGASYTVINDCHHPEFKYSQLYRMNSLAELRRPYESLPKGWLSFPKDVSFADPELTFLLVGRGAVPNEKREGTMPLFVWKTGEGGRNYQTFGWELDQEDYLFTRDTFEHLVYTRGFEFSSVSACYFYKKCSVLPLVFRGLVAEREISSLVGNETLACFLKSVVNYTTGMFGQKGHGGKNGGLFKARLTSHLSRKYVSCLESVSFQLAGSIEENNFYVSKRNSPVRKPVKRAGAKLPPVPTETTCKRRKATDAALPIYASVVEFGRLRLLKCMEFLRANVRPEATRILYSQVDNIVLAMSRDTLEDAVATGKKTEFERDRENFIRNSPGKLVEKWKVSAASGVPWKFASARPCSYGLVAAGDGKGQAKMSGLSGVSCQAALESNLNIIEGRPGLSFLQVRRTNALLNRDTTAKTIRQLPQLHKQSGDENNSALANL